MLVSAAYGFNDPGGRSQLWRELIMISANISSPWVVLSDFNAIRNPDERRGKVDPSLLDIESFNDCIDDDNLYEADYKGVWFTWDNHQLGSNLVLSKIDRVL